MWTRHERRAALSRMIRENYEYLLVYIVDDTEIEALDGISPDIGYLAAKDTSQEEIVSLLAQKVSQSELIANQVVVNRCCKFILETLYEGGHEEKLIHPYNRKALLNDGSIWLEYQHKHPDSTTISYLGKETTVFKIALDILIRDGYIYKSDYEGMLGTFHDLTLKGWNLFEYNNFDGTNIEPGVFLKELIRTLVEIGLQLKYIVNPTSDSMFFRNILLSPKDRLSEIDRLYTHLLELIQEPGYEALKNYLPDPVPPDALDVEMRNLHIALNETCGKLHNSIVSGEKISAEISKDMELTMGMYLELAEKLKEVFADLGKKLGLEY